MTIKYGPKIRVVVSNMFDQQFVGIEEVVTAVLKRVFVFFSHFQSNSGPDILKSFQ